LEFLVRSYQFKIIPSEFNLIGLGSVYKNTKKIDVIHYLIDIKHKNLTL